MPAARACPQRKREAFGRSCGGGTAQYGGDGTAQSGGARLGRLVEKERRCERESGAVGGQAGEKVDGRAGEAGRLSGIGRGTASGSQGLHSEPVGNVRGSFSYGRGAFYGLTKLHPRYVLKVLHDDFD